MRGARSPGWKALALVLIVLAARGTAVCGDTQAVTLTGQAEADLKFDDISGPGKHLRQEPDGTHRLTLRGALGYRGFELPFNLFITTDEKSFKQPRDRLNFGVKKTWFGLWVGDNNPAFSSLILNGLRVRGGEAYLKPGPVRIDVVYGLTQRAVEGIADTTGRILRYGTFERSLTAAHIAVTEVRRMEVGFTVLRSEDDASSVVSGGGPEKNTVYGAYFKAGLIPRSLEFETEIALSAWERGVTEWEAALGRLPVKHHKESALTAGLKGMQHGHRFAATFHSTGTYFRSLGNPSLRADKRGIKFSDDFGVFRNRLSLGLGFEWFRDNLAGDLPATTGTHVLTTRLTYSHSRLWPSLDLNFSTYRRANDKSHGTPGAADDRTDSYGVGVRYVTTAWTKPCRLRVAYSHSERIDKVLPASENRRDNIAVGVVANLAKTVDLDLGYVRTDTDFPARDQTTNVNTFHVRGTSKHLGGTFLAFAGAEFVVSSGNVPTFKSTRPALDVGFQYQVTKLLTARASYEHVDFNDDADDGSSYSERILRLTLTHLFAPPGNLP
jgi:hypothetical protein